MVNKVMNTSAEESLIADSSPQAVTIPIAGAPSVSGLIQRSLVAHACCVLAHGAGAGMRHPFLAEVANGLADRGVDSLRYQFPYMDRGSKRPDPPPIAQGTVRAAVAKAASLLPGLALFAGGKSFGGRMTSQAQAASPMPGVRGLVFLGFPLHPPGRPSDERGKHLFEIKIPMLFLQGGRDEFANLRLLQRLTDQLGARATLKLFPNADHSFHVPVRTGQKDPEIRAKILDATKDWIEKVLSASYSNEPKG
jgi:uncharacterized protein